MATEKKERKVLEKTDYAIRYSDGTILVKMVRFSYPHVYEPQPMKDKKTGAVTKKFSIVGLMPKETHADAKKMLTKAINKLLQENNKGEKIPADKKFLRDGDPKDEDDVGKPENAGMWTISAGDPKKRPILLDKKKDPDTGKPRRLDPTDDDDKEIIYGGAWGDILIRPWFQNNEFGKRVNASLVAVQFRKDDEPFGSGNISEEAIDETFDTEDDEDAVGGDDDEYDL